VEENGHITVFLLDDHELVRRGVRDLLAGEPGLTVVGEAGTAAEALVRIPVLRPRVAVIDLDLPDGSGVEVCREVRERCPGTACLILAAHSDDRALLDAVTAGASGYMLKAVRGSDLVHAVRDAAEGRSLLDPQSTAHALARLCGPEEVAGEPADVARLAELSEQERRILFLIADGLTNRQIGERLNLAEKTVKNYVSGLLAKLGMERRTQAAAYAARLRAGQAS
jgi:DNA-binding NarL/FixJ family response regulator